ncbi:MAG: hypothetical protein AB8B81_22620 [Halioglobus sp.]
MKRRIKLFLSLVYTVIFLVLASTGVLRSQAGELESASETLYREAAPMAAEIERIEN